MEFQKLMAYEKRFELAMKIFEIAKSFPKEETYSLTDQIRCSLRSVRVNITEACNYIITQNKEKLIRESQEIGKLIHYTISNHGTLAVLIPQTAPVNSILR